MQIKDNHKRYKTSASKGFTLMRSFLSRINSVKLLVNLNMQLPRTVHMNTGLHDT